MEEFDKKLWAVVVEKVKIMPDGRLVFSFKDGTEIEAYRRHKLNLNRFRRRYQEGPTFTTEKIKLEFKSGVVIEINM